jgi:hypothetical protein
MKRGHCCIKLYIGTKVLQIKTTYLFNTLWLSWVLAWLVLTLNVFNITISIRR